MVKKKNKRNLNRSERLRLCTITAVLLPLLYYAAVKVLEHFAVSSAGWKFIAGLLLVIAIDLLIYVLYGSRLWFCKKKQKNGVEERIWVDLKWDIIVMSDALAMLATIVFSSCYLAVNENAAAIVSSITEAMSFGSGRLITDIVNISQNIPFINLGLVVIVLCALLFALVVTPIKLLINLIS